MGVVGSPLAGLRGETELKRLNLAPLRTRCDCANLWRRSIGLTVAKEIPEIRLLLLDDHAMFREGLALSFEREAYLKVVGQYSSFAEAMPHLKGEIAMVLLDVETGDTSGLEFVEAANRMGFEGQILVLTAGVTGEEAVKLIQAGVSGIIHKRHTVAELCEVLRKVAGGERWLENDYLTPLFRSVDRTRGATRPQLTERDRLVMRAIFHGLSNKDIAGRLKISEGAVKASIRQLFDKLGSRTRAQLVRIAVEQFKDQL